MTSFHRFSSHLEEFGNPRSPVSMKISTEIPRRRDHRHRGFYYVTMLCFKSYIYSAGVYHKSPFTGVSFTFTQLVSLSLIVTVPCFKF